MRDMALLLLIVWIVVSVGLGTVVEDRWIFHLIDSHVSSACK